MKQRLHFKERFASALFRVSLLAVLLFGAAAEASAQSQVTGKVSDKDGHDYLGSKSLVYGAQKPHFHTVLRDGNCTGCPGIKGKLCRDDKYRRL